MLNKLTSLLPLGGGAAGGGIKGFTIGMITLGGILQVILYAALGAVVGYFVKLLLDKLVKKKKDLKN